MEYFISILLFTGAVILSFWVAIRSKKGMMKKIKRLLRKKDYGEADIKE